MGEKLPMDFVEGLNVHQPAGYIQFGLPSGNPLTTMEDEPKDQQGQAAAGRVQDNNLSQAQNLGSGMHQADHATRCSQFPSDSSCTAANG